MTPERWRRIDELLAAALERSPAERDVFLEQQCGEDQDLRREVASLLAHVGQADSLLEHPAADIVSPGPARVGQTFGHYRIVSLVAAGGMGEVYRAQDLRLRRDVALKILPAELADNPQARARFEREARAIAALSHPNILAIYDFDTQEEISFAVMELLDGETVRGYLSRSSLGWSRALEIGIAVADGLAAAHGKDIVHRDIKPENIFLSAHNQVKILDFGIARMGFLAEASSVPATATTETKPGSMIGTIGYMSPEQVRGEVAGPQSDVFSLGCVLYEMVTGRQPFDRPTVAETLASILRDRPPPLDVSVPSELERIIGRCLEKQPTDRFPSGREVGQALRAVSAHTQRQRFVGFRLRLSAWLIAALATMLLATVASLIIKQSRSGSINSLAILPFVNVEANPDTEYLSDGITETLINSLSRLPHLTVMSRESALQYKWRKVSAQAAGRELGVKAVLTGRTEQRGDNLSIAAELIEVRNNRQLWGDRYDRKFADLLTIQQEIVKQITEKLRITLSREEQTRLSGRLPETTEAYRLYLKGRYYVGKFNEADFKKGLSYFNQAIDLDPNYALAYVGVADAYFWLSDVYLPPKEAMPKSRAAALRALELDDSLPEAYASLATITYEFDWDWPAAERAYRRAIELKPGYAHARHMYGHYLVAMGRPEEALSELKRAQECDPLSVSIAITAVCPFFFAPPGQRRIEQAVQELTKIKSLYPDSLGTHNLLAMVYAYEGKHEEAIAEAEKARELGSAKTPFVARVAYIYGRAGRHDLARKFLQELEAVAKQQYASSFHRALAHIGVKEYDRAFEWLDKAYEERNEELVWLNVYPWLDPLRTDPRFLRLLQRMRLNSADAQ